MVGLWGSGTGLEVFWSSECMPLKEILGPCSLKFLTLFLIHCEFKFVPLLLSTNLCCLNRNQGGLIPCDPCLAPQKVRGRVNTSSYNLSQVWHNICRKWMYSLFYTFIIIYHSNKWSLLYQYIVPTGPVPWYTFGLHNLLNKYWVIPPRFV